MTASSRRRFTTSPDFGQSIAIAALSFLAADQERLERFLSATGLGPENLRRAAADPAFLLSVLDYYVGDEALLLAFAEEQGLSPEDIVRARDSLAGPPPLESNMTAALLCRDCLARRTRDVARCPHCGSPRAADLSATAGLTIAHVDCDAFYASVEKRDHPDVRDKPLIVGGLGARGVVLTACYIARTFGVRSAMPMARARAICPQAVVLPPDMAKYARVGREVRAMMGALTPLVEPLSIDEAFLDLAGCEGANGAGPAETLVRFAGRVEKELGVTVSIGLSYCKFLAKLASDLDKPRGFAAIRREEALA